ncbi:hypothetical protein [Desulfosporosinus youngiae]|uniref:Cor1/Xlr/Xmr conserved region n=1 Tax=Desulfosporosinus youngiae DSM 17734 TaxID=768710 RepID=H5XWS2_9FIRM|nr:hypothetical protein [Desulfosporosinus youngiae]EHQ90721.1 Cor1/Xlr/Xmr conserved region [Desulfosporosinus youngiae DSM 17734]
MENDKFQEFMADQFAKMFKEMQGLRTELKGDMQELRTELKGEMQGLRTELKGDIQALKSDIVRLEDKFDKQISALHDFRVSQDQVNNDNKDAHTTFGTKIEELQLESRITDEKLDEIAEDVSYLAKKSFRQEKQLAKLNVGLK